MLGNNEQVRQVQESNRSLAAKLRRAAANPVPYFKTAVQSVAHRLPVVAPPHRRAIRSWVIDRSRYVRDWARVINGGIVLTLTGDTPRSSHSALVNLYIASGGKANDRLSRMVEMAHPPYKLPAANGVLGDLGEADLARIQSRLETDGYCVFENVLSPEFCQRLVDKTLQLDCLMLGDEEAAKGAQPRRGRYDRKAPKAAKYLATNDDTTDIEEVQELMSDPSLLAVAQNYLRSKPIFSGISLWWSPAIKDVPDSEAAQEFHWDMERIRWLRFFIYLTDVTHDSGPHCFIKGTHRTGAIPERFRNLGYARIKDKTIIDYYGQDSYLEFVGRRGTIIAEDSRGFHKGMLPLKEDRLLLAFELSNTTFGANKRHAVRNIRVPRFGEFARKFSRLYANFDFDRNLLA